MLDETISLRISLKKEEVNTLPTTNGIYIFRNEREIQYIGKSINIKARVASHIENAKQDPKEAAIVQNSTILECIITDSEFNALLLESRLIQKYLPPYNSIWKDDKSYLYVKVTVKDDYPKIFPVRRENDKKSRYFGPFHSMRTVEEILKEIRKVFPFCTSKKISKRPCFYSKIGMCIPCPNAIEKSDDPALIKELKKEYRWNIRQIIKVFEGNTDLVLKDLYKQLNELKEQGSYEEGIQLRNKIYRFEHLISQRLFTSDLFPNYNQSETSLADLLKLLNEFFPELTKLHRIECYDMSNMSLKEATSSMVVAVDGLIDKSQYRKFKIKNLESQSDFEFFEETLTRRFHNKWEFPDLVVVDGGKPQVRIAQKVLDDLKIQIPLIGIAKHPDRLVISKDTLPTVRPTPQNLGFNLIKLLRDESHRFAKKYHLFLRDQKLMK
ncbi:MAG: GIY-YIG nuclease family protein [Patescibacteria group bacterium]